MLAMRTIEADFYNRIAVRCMRAFIFAKYAKVGNFLRKQSKMSGHTILPQPNVNDTKHFRFENRRTTFSSLVIARATNSLQHFVLDQVFPPSN